MPPFHRNPQYNNVGNRGDILKHGVLVRLLGEILRSGPNRIAYVDPYAFIPAWPCAIRPWVHETDALVSTAPGLAEYRKLEHAELRSGRPYLCSVGIVQKVLVELHPRLLLAEKESFERAVLQEDLGAGAVVENSAAKLGEGLKDFLADQDMVVALVDPFSFNTEAEGVLRALLGAVGERRWAAVLFDYSERAVPGFAAPLVGRKLWARRDKRQTTTATKTGERKTFFYHVGLAGTVAGVDDVAAACGMGRMSEQDES